MLIELSMVLLVLGAAMKPVAEVHTGIDQPRSTGSSAIEPVQGSSITTSAANAGQNGEGDGAAVAGVANLSLVVWSFTPSATLAFLT